MYAKKYATICSEKINCSRWTKPLLFNLPAVDEYLACFIATQSYLKNTQWQKWTKMDQQ